VHRHSPGRAKVDDSRERKTQAPKEARQSQTQYSGRCSPGFPTDHAACGSCKGWAGSRGNVDEGLTCCEFSGELLAELCGLGVIDRLTMYSSGKELKMRRFQ